MMTRGAFVILCVLVVAACGSTDRPTVAEWEPVWDAATRSIPTEDDLGDPPAREVCGQALGFIRSAEADLLPTPDRSIDPVIREWVQVAEDMFFECPPQSREVPDMSSGFAELQRLQAEVAAALNLEGG
jgi:hypothetical protein